MGSYLKGRTKISFHSFFPSPSAFPDVAVVSGWEGQSGLLCPQAQTPDIPELTVRQNLASGIWLCPGLSEQRGVYDTALRCLSKMPKPPQLVPLVLPKQQLKCYTWHFCAKFDPDTTAYQPFFIYSTLSFTWGNSLQMLLHTIISLLLFEPDTQQILWYFHARYSLLVNLVHAAACCPR